MESTTEGITEEKHHDDEELDAKEKRERLDKAWKEACERSDRGKTI